MYHTEYESPLGTLKLFSDGEAITGLYLPEQKHIPEEKVFYDGLPVFCLAKNWLSRYFAGEKPTVDFPVKTAGTDFQHRVWELLREIPYGKSVTYGELAGRIGPKMSPQAVGGAVGRNPVSIIIPCHRCLGAGNKLTGYAGGIKAKQYLLQLEANSYDRK